MFDWLQKKSLEAAAAAFCNLVWWRYLTFDVNFDRRLDPISLRHCAGLWVEFVRDGWSGLFGLNVIDGRSGGGVYFRFLWIFLLIQLSPSLTPSPFMAEQAWMCHGRSRMVCRLRPSAMSLDLAAFIKSCLLANMSTGTPMSFSSAKSSLSSLSFSMNIKWILGRRTSHDMGQTLTSPVSSKRFRSELSIT